MPLTAGNPLKSENLAPKFDCLYFTRSAGAALFENFNMLLTCITLPVDNTRLKNIFKQVGETEQRKVHGRNEQERTAEVHKSIDKSRDNSRIS